MYCTSGDTQRQYYKQSLDSQGCGISNHAYCFKMGAILSAVRQLLFSLRSVISLISNANEQFDQAQQRVSKPRLPGPSTTESFWQNNPLFPELVNIRSKTLPSSADIAIIGSGIAGASVAHTILNECEATGIKKRVVLLEAREICSGATGRNGGHIKATPYHAYSQYTARFGAAHARKLCEFEMMHLSTLLEIARREEFYAAEVREVETVDVFTDHDMWKKAQVMVRELQSDVPSLAESISVHTAGTAQEVHPAYCIDETPTLADLLYRNLASASIASAQ